MLKAATCSSFPLPSATPWPTWVGGSLAALACKDKLDFVESVALAVGVLSLVLAVYAEMANDPFRQALVPLSRCSLTTSYFRVLARLAIGGYLW